ncbi:MAG TPA: DNA polymerase III subunit delta [Polyangia bacterium]|nr:DNA polymerase III subunit delta [Polyangia bacterium]
MPPREEKDVFAAIAGGEIDPVYCLHGPERFLIDRCLGLLKTAVLGPSAGHGLNLDAFELKETGLTAALNAAQTLPMFAKRRMVVGRGIDLLKSEELEGLAAYAGDPNPKSCLVLTGEKIDGRLKPFMALKKAGFVHEFPRLRDRELPAWIAREASTRKIAIDADGAQALAESAGPDLGRLSQALEQLSLYVGSGGRIRREEVETLIAETRERGVFELTKAIGDGNVPRSLALVGNMLANREPPLRIQFMLVRQLRQIWRAKELVAAGAPRMEIAGAVGIAPFFLDDILLPARRMSEAALERSFRRLYQSDRALKSSRLDPELAITRLIRQLAEDARGPATSRGR